MNLTPISSNFGNCSITRAKILVGLELAWNVGYRRICLQIDSIVVGLILTKNGDLSHQHAREVMRFRELINRDWVVSLKHSRR
ncbi:hypothetical protein LINPERPRIM_LOCUS42128 [Linum perenne]